MIRITAIGGAVATTLAAWNAAASMALLVLIGRFAAFPGWWGRCAAWWSYAASPYAADKWMKLWLGLSGVTAAVPLIIIWVLVCRASTSRNKLRRPIGGGTRPIERAATDNHGQARFLTEAEWSVKYPGPAGVVIGESLNGKPGRGRLAIDPCGDGAGHSLLIAGTRAGKSSSAITTLLHWPGSAVVLDPSGEMGTMLKGTLEAQGKRVFLLDPSDPATGFNAIDWIDPTSPLAAMDAWNVISWIFPDDKGSDTKKDDYFTPSKLALAMAILSDLIASNRPPHEKSLATLRRLLATPEDQMKPLLAQIHQHSQSSVARDIAGTMKGMAERQWSGVYGGAITDTMWLSIPAYGNLVSGSAFRAADILDGNTVVFAQIPFPALADTPGVGRVIIGTLLNAVYRAEGKVNGRVLFLLDEARTLGRMRLIESALVIGAKYGVQFQFLYQSIGHVKEVWGDNKTTLYNNLSWRGYAAAKDKETSEEISNDIGDIGVMAWSEGTNSGRQRQFGFGPGSRSTGDTSTTHEIKRRLRLPQEIREADPDELFVTTGQYHMHLRMPMYWRRRELAEIVAANKFEANKRRVA